METYDIYKLEEDLQHIQNLLLDIISRDREIRRYGLSLISSFDSYEKASVALPSLDAKLSDFSRTANFINPAIGEKFDDLIKRSGLSQASAEISVSLKISERTRTSPISNYISSIRGALNQLPFGLGVFAAGMDKGSPFQVGEGQIDITGMLVDIERISPILGSIRDEMYARVENDFEAFTPSGIDIDKVNRFVQIALDKISESGSMPLETKENIEIYLKDISAELARKTPAWKKIVGALVIISTLLSGLNVAPEALENVRGALQEIMGPSVKKATPKPEYDPSQIPNFTVTNAKSGQDPQDV